MVETAADEIATGPDWAVDVVLRDGSTVRLRRLSDADRPAIERLVAGLSDQSRYFRLLQGTRRRDTLLSACLVCDYPTTLSLVAERGGEVLGVATWARLDASAAEAEVGFLVAEPFHGHGLGTRMLERLAELARPLGIATFEAWVHAANHEMLAVFQHSGFRYMYLDVDAGVNRLVLEIDETPAFTARAAVRAGTAASASLRPFFHPQVIAVVGASRTRGKIGAEVFHAIRAGGFTGRVVPVNPAADQVDGVAAVPRVTDVAGVVDLVVIAVPAAQVDAVVDDCVAKGVRAVVVLSAGFADSGVQGQAHEARLLAKVRAAGIRMIGPNCLGLIETDPAVSLNASLAQAMPAPGSVAFLSQSGALGLAIVEHARRLDLGISTFVSVGNKADVSGNDLLQYWAQDARTRVVLLYLEDFGNPRTFSRIAQRVSRRTPIVAVKAGRSGAGTRAAGSHASALATDDRVVDALFDQAGVIRTDTIEELFDVASVLAHQSLPRGNRVAILTNAGGPGLLAVDACEAGGLEVLAFGAALKTALRRELPAAASVANPVDLLASASPDDYRRALSLLRADPAVDAILVQYVPVFVDRGGEVASVLTEAARLSPATPMLATFLDAGGTPPSLKGVPAFTFPETAARALARVARYAAWRRRVPGKLVCFADVNTRAVGRIVDSAVAAGRTWLQPQEVRALLDAAGVSQLTSQLQEGIEMLVGALQHPMFGPLVACGAGGALADVLQDTTFRLTPLTDADATAMVRGLRVAALLDGHRGGPPADQRALRDTLLRISLLVEACPSIQEIELNPVRVMRRGAFVCDARVRVDATPPSRSRRIWY